MNKNPMLKMNKFLIFSDLRLEQEYKKYYHIDAKEKYKIFMYIELIYGMAYLTSAICYYFLSEDDGARQNVTWLSIRIIAIFVVWSVLFGLSLLVIKNTITPFCNIDIILFILAILIQFTFNNPITTKYNNPCIIDMGYQSFWEGYEVQFYNVIICQLFNQWIYKFTFFLTSSTYFYFYKNQNIDDRLEFIKVTAFIIAYGIMVYYYEKAGRLNYIQMKKLVDKEKTWKEITDSLPEGVLLVDKKTKPVYRNYTIEDYLTNLEKNKNNSNCNQDNDNNTDPKENHKTSNDDLNFFFNQVINIKLRNSIEDIKALYKRSMSIYNKNPNSKQHECISLDDISDLLIEQEPNNNPRNIAFVEGFTLNDLISYIHNLNENETIDEFATFDGMFKEKSLEIKAKNILFDGELVLLMIFIDTTHRDLIAKLEQNDKYKSIVLSTVSHELRTPLNSVISMLETAIGDTNILQIHKDELLYPSLRSLNMLASLINDILDYSQIQANKLNLVFQSVDLRQVITHACSLFDIQCKRKGIRLKVDIGNEVPSLIRTDPNRLTQVLLNLLSNAIKFTTKGYVKVSVKGDMFKKGRFVIAVKDTGIGIKQEELGKLFQDFVKIDLGENARLNPTGCGLGLSISHKLAMRLDNQDSKGIKVESEVNKGSTFSFGIEDKQGKVNEDREEKKKMLSPMKSPENSQIHIEEFGSKLSRFSTYKIIEETSCNTTITKSRYASGGGCGGSSNGHTNANASGYNGGNGLTKARLSGQDNNSNDHQLEIEEGSREGIFKFKPAHFFTLYNPIAEDKSSTPNTSNRSLLFENQNNRPNNGIMSSCYDCLMGSSSMTVMGTTTTSSKMAKLLVIDDDTINLHSTSLIAKRLNYVCDVGYSAEMGINMIKEKNSCKIHPPYDIIFMDFNMPVMDGLEATKVIKGMILAKELPLMTIIGCTAFLDEASKRKGLEAGMDYVIEKPITKQKLLSLVDIFKRN